MQGVSSKTLTERLIQTAVADLACRSRGTSTPLDISRHLDDPRFCYHHGPCTDAGCMVRKRAGPHMRVLDRPALDWPETWHRYTHLACLAVGHHDSIGATMKRPFIWQRGGVAVRRIDQWLRDLGRAPACTYSARWRDRMFVYLETPVGIAHFSSWLDRHRKRHASAA